MHLLRMKVTISLGTCSGSMCLTTTHKGQCKLSLTSHNEVKISTLMIKILSGIKLMIVLDLRQTKIANGDLKKCNQLHLHQMFVLTELQSAVNTQFHTLESKLDMQFNKRLNYNFQPQFSLVSFLHVHLWCLVMTRRQL